MKRFGKISRNADRLVNRFFDYPRHVRKVRGGFDAFHVCDHSYAQLVHALPAERTGVFCHDLDTFACLLEPARDRRPLWFRAMARRILRGMQKAAIVFHTTDAVRAQMEKYGLIDPAKLIKAPLGTAPEFVVDDDSPAPMTGPFVLHVGSCIPRKRIDVLLETFAMVRESRPDLRLVHVGDEWTDAQRAQIARLGIETSVVCLTRQPRSTLAALYRATTCVLITSDAEGFGLPMAEAMACGAPVVASDIPALREVGGEACVYALAGHAPAYAEALMGVLQAVPGAGREMRVLRAKKFSWSAHADTIAAAYRKLLFT